MEYIRVYHLDKVLFTCEIDNLRVNSNLIKSKFQDITKIIDKLTIITNTINKLEDFITLSDDSGIYHIVNKKRFIF